MTDHEHPDTDLNDPHGEAAHWKVRAKKAEAERDAALDELLDGKYHAYRLENGDFAIAGHGGWLPGTFARRGTEAVEAAPDWTAAARDMLATWEAWMDGGASDRRADTDRLVRAAIFAAQAYEDAKASTAPDSAAGYLLRTFLLALIDWKDPQLDPLRAKNRVAAPRAHDPKE